MSTHAKTFYKRLIVFMGVLACPSLLMADIPSASVVRFCHFCSWMFVFAHFRAILVFICVICAVYAIYCAIYAIYTGRRKLLAALALFALCSVTTFSLLPFLGPRTDIAKYNDEVVPAISEFRTRIGLYQYETGKLPCLWDGTNNDPVVVTWMPLGNGRYAMGSAKFSGEEPPLKPTKCERPVKGKNGIQSAELPFDPGDRASRAFRPNHCQYLVMLNDGANYAYFLGCFGDGNGLGIGTGYAVCEIVAKGRKYVGTWSRYKKIAEVQPCFTSNSSSPYDYDCFTLGCFVPDKASFDNMTVVDGCLDVIHKMSACGWNF